MASDAATATTPIMLPTAPIIILLTIAAAVTLCYGWLCWMRPFRRCSRCDGHGWHTTALLGRRRTCPRCRGEGWRLRHGRRVYNHLRHLRHAAHPHTTNHTTNYTKGHTASHAKGRVHHHEGNIRP